jgi:hypothetical protein
MDVDSASRRTKYFEIFDCAKNLKKILIFFELGIAREKIFYFRSKKKDENSSRGSGTGKGKMGRYVAKNRLRGAGPGVAHRVSRSHRGFCTCILFRVFVDLARHKV